MNRRSLFGRMSLIVLLVSLLGLDFEAAALPKDPAPRPALRSSQREEVMVARARRRRYRRPTPHHPKAAPKPAPKPEPADDEADTPSAGTSGAAPAGPGPSDPGSLQRGGRVEFDGRLVQGQTAKSGAIYLFARQRTDLRSMVRERDTYRREVLRTVYPDWNK